MEYLRCCSYGTLERSNVVIFDDRLFSLIITVGLTIFLFNNVKLRRLYSPLVSIVNFTLIMRLFQDISYFIFYPYDPSSVLYPGNCIEIILSRVSLVGVMLGELHQFYLLANVLGVGDRRLNICCMVKPIKLAMLLRYISYLMIISTTGSIFYRKTRFLSNLWYPVTSVLQIYIINLSITDVTTGQQLISGLEPSVTLYKKLASLQILPAIISFLYRCMTILLPKSTELRLFLGSIEVIFNHLDLICDFLSFLKILVIAENSDVKVEVLN
jgi:hypothetical protein